MGLLLLGGFIYNVHELCTKPPAQGLPWAWFETAAMGVLGTSLACAGTALGGSENPGRRRWALSAADMMVVAYLTLILVKWGLCLAGLIPGKRVSLLGPLIILFIWRSLIRAKRVKASRETARLAPPNVHPSAASPDKEFSDRVLLLQKRQELIPVVRRWVLASWVAVLLVCPVAVWQPLAGFALSLLVPAIAGLLLKRVGEAAQSRATLALSKVYPIAALAVLAMPLLLDNWLMSVLFDPGPVPCFAAAIPPGLVAASCLPFVIHAWTRPIDNTVPCVCRQCGYLLCGLTDPRCPQLWNTVRASV